MQSLAVPALSLGYASTVVLLWQDPVVAAAPDAVLVRRPHGAHELPAAVAHLHDDLLQLRARDSTGAWARWPNSSSASSIYSAQVPLQPVVAEHAPLRADGVAVAPDDLRANRVQPFEPSSLLSQFLDLLLRALAHELLQIVGRLGILRHHLDRLLGVAERLFACCRAPDSASDRLS